MPSSEKRRILITGATGLLGSYVARYFAQEPDWELVATRRQSSSLHLVGDTGKQIEWRTGDLTDFGYQEELLSNVDTVVHLAGLVSYAPNASQALREYNQELTEDLVNLSLRHGITQFLHFSSIAAISPVDPQLSIREDRRSFYPDPTTTRYAKSKHAAELEVWRGSEEGLPVTILNPAVVLGAGYWDRSSCQLFPWVDRGQKFYPPGSTGYVDVRDVARFASRCVRHRLTGERFVLSAENWTYKQFFDAIADELKVQPPSIEVKKWQAELAWRAEAMRGKVVGKPPLLTRESARRSLGQHVMDNERSLAAGADYRPVADTIRDVATCYQQTKDQGYGILPIT